MTNEKHSTNFLADPLARQIDGNKLAKKRVDKNKELKDKRKEEIQNSAKQLFIKKGWNKTTIRDIVAEAGTSIGNFYFYFSNKRALLESILDELKNDIRSDIDLIYSSLPTTTAKLAATTFILINKLTQSPLYANLFKGIPETRTTVARYYREGLKKLFENDPGMEGAEIPRYAALAWEGVSMILLDYYDTKEFSNDISELIPFLIRWNLKAIETPAEEIEETMKTFMQYLVTHTHLLMR